MFHIYEGFHLVDAYHKVRHQRKYHPEDSAKRVVKIAIVALVTLLLWNIPTEWFGIQNLTVIQQRVIAIFAFATLMSQFMGHIDSHHGTDVAILYGQWYRADGKRGRGRQSTQLQGCDGLLC